MVKFLFRLCIYKKHLFSSFKVLCTTTVLKSRDCHTNKMYKATATNLQELNSAQSNDFLNSFDTVISDCDGVLWVSDNAIPGSVNAMNFFRKIGKTIFYVTNNSTKTRLELTSKLQGMGFKANENEIIATPFLAALYLNNLNFNKKVYIFGSIAIAKELEVIGIQHIGVGPDPVKADFRNMQPSELETDVGAVIVGFDEHISYTKLIKAATYLASEECLFIATNTDVSPKRGQIVMPAASTMVCAVEAASNRKAEVLGKPYAFVKLYLDTCGLIPERTLMVGDTCSTDIEFGVRFGFQTLLVLSGNTSAKDVEKIQKEKQAPVPDFVLPTLGHLLNIIPL